MKSSDPPALTSDSVRPRPKRSAWWRAVVAVVFWCLAVALALFFLTWWLVAPGRPLHNHG